MALCALLRGELPRQGILDHQRHRGHWWGEVPVGGNFAAFVWLGFILDDINMDGFEDGAVQPAPFFVGDGVVKRDRSAHEVQQQVNALAGGLDAELALSDDPLRILDLMQNPRLSAFQVGFLNDAVEVGVEQTLLLAVEYDQAALLRLGEHGVILLVQLELNLDIGRHGLDLVFREMHFPPPFAPDFLLYFFGGQVWQVAGTAAGVPAEAEEVGILPTLAA